MTPLRENLSVKELESLYAWARAAYREAAYRGDQEKASLLALYISQVRLLLAKKSSAAAPDIAKAELEAA